MIITVDTSAVLAVLLNEAHKPGVIKVTQGHSLQAPFSLDAEFGNALSAMFRRNRITLEQAKQVLKQFKSIPIRRTPLRISEAIRISAEQRIYAYDAYMLDCALQFNTPLLSLDQHLTATASTLGISLIEI